MIVRCPDTVVAMWRLALVVALCVVLGACAAPVAGTPSAAPAVRPREVRLEGVNTCSLLTPAQVVQLGLEGSGLRDQRNGQDSCGWSGFKPREIATLISAVPIHGIQDYDTNPSHNNVTVIEIRGYPALQLSYTTRSDNCAVGVDVAPGQLVDVEFSAYTSPVPLADLCAGARQVADYAIGNLLAQR